MAYRSVNPASGELIKTFDDVSDGEFQAVLSSAHSCYENTWRTTSLSDRVALARTSAADLRDRVAEHAALLTCEIGKLIGEAEGEVRVAAKIFEYYADHAQQFLADKEIPDSPGAVIETAPIGAIIAIEPWNMPYYQISRVVAPQMIAGNVVVAKLAKSVPQCALAFAELFVKAGAAEGLYSNVFANHDQLSAAVADPRVAGVTLTGSVGAGATIAEQAGRNLKKTVMELGGSDPFLVLEDADLEHAVAGAVAGRLYNTGQSCMASKRIIVVGRDRGGQFLESFVEQMASQKAGDPMDPKTSLGPVSSERALETLLDQVHAARNGGARVVIGGRRIARDGFYMEPTVLTDIEAANPACGTEFFGPVASFYVVDSQDDAVTLANATRFGLGAAVFTSDLSRGRAVAAQIDSGMVFVNQPAWSAPEIPFGGTKSSGFGRELSELGIGEFVNRKLVNVAPVGSVPWGPVSP